MGNKEYRLFRENNSDHDGVAFVGVSSTGIYCRPVCKAKTPKEENCTYYKSAAHAESKGFRPCKLCRPELSPKSKLISPLTLRATTFIEENLNNKNIISELPLALKTTEKELEQFFQDELGVTAEQYLLTQRMLFAKSLLKDTSLSVDEIGEITGLTGDMAKLFRKHYKLPPESFRGKQSEAKETITLKIGYRPPYAWDEILGFLEGRAIPGVEMIQKDAYIRTVRLEGLIGWIKVENKPKESRLSVTISKSLSKVLPEVMAKVRRLFDTDCHPNEIHSRLISLEDITEAKCVPGIRLPGAFDPFEMSVRAILGQQITVKAARTLAMRFAHKFGTEIETPFEGLDCVFPTPQKIMDLPKPIEDQLGPLGVTGIRSRAILALSEGIVKGEINFGPEANPQEQFKKLLELPGFGPWTVEYVGMRAFGYPDSFPHTDYGVKKVLPDLKDKERLEISKRWLPYRSYATMTLWNHLGGLEK